jgi:hypothetical protein
MLAILSLSVFVVVAILILSDSGQLEGHDERFAYSALALLSVVCATYLMDGEVIYNVWLGYDIDKKTLTLRHMEWSILNLLPSKVISRSKTLPSDTLPALNASPNTQQAQAQQEIALREAQLVHFRQNKDQIPAEITRVRADITGKQTYISALEDLQFISSSQGNDSSRGGSSYAPSAGEQPEKYQDDAEAKVNI